ncbi:hypothetical protein ABZW18_00450 [Streptomyces sp. NPDC004647]|uniref:hypothetical protein n=1 Tax=Streptomyces sp. NPDC004647 TaxID=3154671 RepID=UPI0033B69C36
MPEPAAYPEIWADRLTTLKDSAHQRVLAAPMPAAAMTQLLETGRATELGPFAQSPVRYLDRWWRETEGEGWVALDAEGSAQVDRHAERYWAATRITTTPAGAPETDIAVPPPDTGVRLPRRGTA